MPIAYVLSADKAVIYENWTGDITAEELRDYWTTYLQDLEVMTIRRTLVDLREAHIRFNGAQLSGLISAVVVPALQGKDWISALLVGESVHFGVSRQYQVFAELYSRDAIFDDADKAEEWLRQQVHKT